MLFSALLPLGIVFFVLQGIFFYAYYTLRDSTLREAKSRCAGKPAALFVDAMVNCVINWIVATIAIVVSAWCFFLVPLLVMIPYSFFCWYRILRDARREQEEQRNVLEKFPIPKLQFHIQDLWVFAGLYGLVITLLMLFLESGVHKPGPGKKFALSMVALVVETAAFLICMDICRRSNALKNIWQRTRCTILVMGFAAIPFMIIIEIMAWQAWRYALWKSQVPELKSPT